MFSPGVAQHAERRLYLTEVGGENPFPRDHLSWLCGEELGRGECPYLRRWVLDFKFSSLRLHHWMASDDQRHPHDHPWWFWSLVLRGRMTECPANVDPLRPGKLREVGSLEFFQAEHRHSVRVTPGEGCWTLLLTGPEKRVWGFWVNGRFRKRNKYFYMKQHHPCERGE